MINLNKTAKLSISCALAFVIIYASYQVSRIGYTKVRNNADSVIYDEQWRRKKTEEIQALRQQEETTQEAIAALTSQIKTRIISREDDRVQFNSLTQQYIDIVKKRTEAEAALNSKK